MAKSDTSLGENCLPTLATSEILRDFEVFEEHPDKRLTDIMEEFKRDCGAVLSDLGEKNAKSDSGIFKVEDPVVSAQLTLPALFRGLHKLDKVCESPKSALEMIDATLSDKTHSVFSRLANMLTDNECFESARILATIKAELEKILIEKKNYLVFESYHPSNVANAVYRALEGLTSRKDFEQIQNLYLTLKKGKFDKLFDAFRVKLAIEIKEKESSGKRLSLLKPLTTKEGLRAALSAGEIFEKGRGRKTVKSFFELGRQVIEWNAYELQPVSLYDRRDLTEKMSGDGVIRTDYGKIIYVGDCDCWGRVPFPGEWKVILERREEKYGKSATKAYVINKAHSPI
ncbi:MAG: hypothetical protein UT55_C0002G0015 [Candidatus Peregrinibacteria bacterium GW2011_GWE2_39_6]|nr:MAG: hypothetical protein UT36_C0002G0042 [Candidatus Peregrinibacteria bacterium GW2011_GWF2_39_17]KKR26753.1 MAG: hypothetical protein UT55_C0002G0015 [Candidatus Peregrinibacteria bacterium GW2011_GWE2_39_6]HCW32147.1 hypothetical protein [Candidatus Peregrinibacteria bacterium]